jgi:hypothetical protein
VPLALPVLPNENSGSTPLRFSLPQLAASNWQIKLIHAESPSAAPQRYSNQHWQSQWHP